jgi:hypothetical protein
MHLWKVKGRITMSDDQVKPKLEVVDPTSADDPYDLSKLRVSQNFLESTAVKKLLTTVPVRKPLAQDFVRVHESAKYRALVAILELKEDRETYVVDLTRCPNCKVSATSRPCSLRSHVRG